MCQFLTPGPYTFNGSHQMSAGENDFVLRIRRTEYQVVRICFHGSGHTHYAWYCVGILQGFFPGLCATVPDYTELKKGRLNRWGLGGSLKLRPNTWLIKANWIHLHVNSLRSWNVILHSQMMNLNVFVCFFQNSSSDPPNSTQGSTTNEKGAFKCVVIWHVIKPYFIYSPLQ